MLRLLECALALERHRNFARAAEFIGVSQPTLTRNIQDLERLFCVKLFDRTRQGIMPTVYGTTLLQGARCIKAEVENLHHEIELLRGLKTGGLTLGIGPLVAQTWMPDLIAGLLTEHPGLQVCVLTHDWWDLVPAINERRIEVAIGELEPDIGPEIEITPLPHRPLRFFCRRGHPLTTLKAPKLADIGNYALVSPRLPRRAGEFLSGTRAIGRLAENGKYFEPQIECQSFEAALRIVRSCDAIGIAPLSRLKPLLRQENIKVIAFEAGWLRTNYGILTLRNRTLPPPAQKFLDQVVEAERLFHERGSSINGSKRLAG